MFEIGDEVVCIDATIKPEMLLAVVNFYPSWVKEGEKYTVRGFTSNNGIVDGMWVEEISNPEIYIKLIDRTQEPAFGLFRFAKSEKSAQKETIKEEQYAEF